MRQIQRHLKLADYVKLKDIFERKFDDVQALEELCHELSFRESPEERNLWHKVEARLNHLKKCDPGLGRKVSSSQQVMVDSKSVLPVPFGVDGGSGSALRAPGAPLPGAHSLEWALAVLRATFTEEGELLARWGMTPNLPQSLQVVLVAAWRAHLDKSPTADGKTAAEFEADLKRLEVLRATGK
jgi:hypothetical protein